MEAIAKVTRKFQTTIPKPVREALGVREGDSVLFELSDTGRVTLRRVEPLDVAFLESLDRTLGEWSSEHDEAAYGDL